MRPAPPSASRMVVRGLIGGVLIVCLIGAAIAAGVLLTVDSVGDELRKTPSADFKSGVLDAPEPGEPQTLLVVGTDRRYGAAKGETRADTLMLIRLDPAQEGTAVLNVPRDLVVEIPGRGRAKINEAYAVGGLSLVTEMVKTTLGLDEINHAMAVDFKGFRRVVNTLDCVYSDVDRRYFNDNSGPGEDYAVIDVQPGYQRLCGQSALDYVRYRHGDSDFARAARQQTFLRHAKDQIATSTLVKSSDQLLKIFTSSTQTDPSLRENKQVLRLLEQGALVAGKPVRRIAFSATFTVDGKPGGLGSYLTASLDAIDQSRTRFLAATSEKQELVRPRAVAEDAAKARRGEATEPADFGLVDARRQGAEILAPLAASGKVGFPIYFPRSLSPRGRWTGSPPEPRVYELRDAAGQTHQAYRLVFTENALYGDYYGVQGTTWRSPPILAQGYERLRMRGRDYRLFYDGKKLRIVAWQTPSGTYWVSNTLGLALLNTEMLGIARSLVRAGA